MIIIRDLFESRVAPFVLGLSPLLVSWDLGIHWAASMPRLVTWYNAFFEGDMFFKLEGFSSETS